MGCGFMQKGHVPDMFVTLFLPYEVCASHRAREGQSTIQQVILDLKDVSVL